MKMESKVASSDSIPRTHTSVVPITVLLIPKTLPTSVTLEMIQKALVPLFVLHWSLDEGGRGSFSARTNTCNLIVKVARCRSRGDESFWDNYPSSLPGVCVHTDRQKSREIDHPLVPGYCSSIEGLERLLFSTYPIFYQQSLCV